MPYNNQIIKTMENFKIELETKVIDKHTGFTGVVTARTQYIKGDNSYCVEGHVTDPGNKPPVLWLEEYRLEKYRD
jgi:hypothetical protein